MPSWKSIGCEARGLALKDLPPLVRDQQIDHIQVTYPSFEDFSSITDTELPIVLHSNLLNSMGENSWDLLKIPAKKIKPLRPIHVIEHFTLFRDLSFKKHAVYMPDAKEEKAITRKAVENLLKWQEMVGHPVLLENTPVTGEVNRYFDMLLNVAEIAKCRIALDVPHLILSATSSGMDEATLQRLALQINPLHIHLGGVSSRDLILRDNHQTYSPWITDLARRLFSSAEYATLEQGPRVPTRALKNWLTHTRHSSQDGTNETFDFSPTLRVMPHEYFNQMLADEDSRALAGIGSAERESPHLRPISPESDPLSIFDMYMPFFYPIASLRKHASSLTPKEAITSVAAVARMALLFTSIWHEDQESDYLIGYGTSEISAFIAPIRAPRSDNHSVLAKQEFNHIFDSSDGSWIGLKWAPNLRTVTTTNHRRLT